MDLGIRYIDSPGSMGYVRPVGQMRPKVKSDQILFTLFLFWR